jgi:hypothetical protein
VGEVAATYASYSVRLEMMSVVVVGGGGVVVVVSTPRKREKKKWLEFPFVFSLIF